MGKFRASLEPSWAMKIARCVEQLTRRSSKYIRSCSFHMSNRVEWFKHMQPRNVISTCTAIYSYSLAIITHNYIWQCIAGTCAPSLNDPLPIALLTVQLLSIWSRFHIQGHLADSRYKVSLINAWLTINSEHEDSAGRDTLLTGGGP